MKLIFTSTLAVLLNFAALPAFADGGSHAQSRAAMHACVHQALAADGIELPPHVRGQPQPQLDPAVQAKVRAAHRSCREQIKTANP